MGFLSDGGGANIEALEDNTEATAQTEESVQQEADEEPAVAVEPPKGEKVQLPSRRQRAAQRNDELSSKLRSIEETLNKRDEEYRRELARKEEELNRLRGGFDAIKPLLERSAQPQAPQGPQETPDDLYAKARSALDAGRFDEYERLHRQAIKLEIKQELAPKQAASPPAVPQAAGPVAPMDPRLQVIMTQHPKVTMHQRGLELVTVKDRELAIMGYTDGPERWKRAFELAEASIGGSETPPRQYSQQGAAAMAAVPTARGQAGAGPKSPGVTLTPEEIRWAKLADMSLEEYAKTVAELHPERVEQ